MLKRECAVICIILSLLCFVTTATGEPDDSIAAGNDPVISIIIDDLGDQLSAGARAVNLPGQVTYAFLPHTSYSTLLARKAHRHDKEVMLHLPMEAVGRHNLGEGGLKISMAEKEFMRLLNEDLDAVPFIRGINNHMGSLLTQHAGYMDWVMRALKKRDDLFFVDSRTTPHSIADSIASKYGVPNIPRDIFLDHHKNPAFIRIQFQKLLFLAKKNGAAVAIGHPYPQTLSVLEAELPKLARKGVKLVSVSELIDLVRAQNKPSQATILAARPIASDRVKSENTKIQ